jgi:ABC-type multidrug transport system fused ATPase/permease subunit
VFTAACLKDESTSALDSESESHVQRAIDELIEAKMQTVVVVAHRLSTVCNADRIAVVGKGRVLEIGYVFSMCYKSCTSKQQIKSPCWPMR